MIFYTTKIKGSDIQKILKHNKKAGFDYNVLRLCDPNVYKLNSKQLFRLSLSNKIFSSNDVGNKFNHWNLLHCAKPSQHIVQIKGDEKGITKKETDPDEFEINEDLIIMSSVELLHLMNEFESTFENF